MAEELKKLEGPIKEGQIFGINSSKLCKFIMVSDDPEHTYELVTRQIFCAFHTLFALEDNYFIFKYLGNGRALEAYSGLIFTVTELVPESDGVENFPYGHDEDGHTKDFSIMLEDSEPRENIMNLYRKIIKNPLCISLGADSEIYEVTDSFKKCMAAGEFCTSSSPIKIAERLRQEESAAATSLINSMNIMVENDHSMANVENLIYQLKKDSDN